ncbi:hypothetical protein GCM10022422_16430 [Flavobacterium ginsengisoli]|uniref:Uncharacterized protein n=1 Tax=Flavobacterium ginsengisoli TaxID=871694 RepID=A0ABP7FCM1_9FLAO|nr:hypothetical protein [Flavobacterium ginsengisoli]
MEFNFTEFKKNIDADFDIATKCVNRIHDLRWEKSFGGLKEPFLFFNEEEEKHDLDLLKFQIKSIELKIIFAIDFLKLDYLRQEFKNDLKDAELSKLIDYYSYADIFYSPRISLLTQYFESIVSVLNVTETEKIEKELIILERILKGTPKILLDNNVEPKNESIVQKCLYNYLIHIFPDTVREIPIPKIAKTYKPDFGIRTLKVAIEYKFVDSESEAKKFCGEIFEDVFSL